MIFFLWLGPEPLVKLHLLHPLCVNTIFKGVNTRDMTRFEFEFDNIRTSNVFNIFEID